jgi:hypothetical protein
MGRKRKNNTIAEVHEELKGLDIKINEFGEVESNIDIAKINEFLTRLVPDKKLIKRKDNAYQQEFKHLIDDKDDDDDDGIDIPEDKEDEDTFNLED